ncbi:hypothetical protein JTE90_000066 [Oedothorax gibbosus]|uniref:Uncharacterized protein n=1 Tax=Oedothorax gibbosus TaxID=931172 RepID=A0AAV6UCV7_9ARAC|nr:hypothetical protein JTE90_000066 [Oedothorax gibbosus]
MLGECLTNWAPQPTPSLSVKGFLLKRHLTASPSVVLKISAAGPYLSPKPLVVIPGNPGCQMSSPRDAFNLSSSLELGMPPEVLYNNQNQLFSLMRSTSTTKNDLFLCFS